MIAFLLRVLLAAASLVFAASLAVVFLALAMVWGVRALWARLTGQPALGFPFRFGPAAAFRFNARGAARRPGPARAQTADVTDVQPKRIIPH